MSEPQEVVVYIHGVSDDPEGLAHTRDYDALDCGIRATPRGSNWPLDCCRVEWGWSDQPTEYQQGHELLTEAQTRFGGLVLERVRQQRDFSLHPGRVVLGPLRKLLMFGISDAFYYVSGDGRNSIRRSVGQQICQSPTIRNAMTQGRDLSLTLVGHSAGSLIAFDLLFYLFWTGPGPNRQSGDQSKPHVFFEGAGFDDNREALSDLEHLRSLRAIAQERKLRLRRLYTFGSPIALLAYRNNAVLRILATGGALSPAYQGFTSELAHGGVPVLGPRWVNVWDKDDPISWPVEPLMEAGRDLVVDRHVNVSGDPAKAHTSYWSNRKVHRLFADSW